LNYIRPCPSCKSELRFPIDRGTLRITCPICSENFLVDPDDTEIYKKGNFDLNPLKPSSKTLEFSDFFKKENRIRILVPVILVILLFLNMNKDCFGSGMQVPIEKKSLPIEDKPVPSSDKPKNEI
jgi:hypothetical protein